MTRRKCWTAAALAVLILSISACGGGTPTATPTTMSTAVPTSTPTVAPIPTEEPTPTQEAAAQEAESTEEPVQYIIEAAEGQEIDPPLQITLPEGWRARNATQLIQDVDGLLRLIPFTSYRGPVEGGEGFIILLWGFEPVTTGNPFDERFNQPDIWLDGLRLLRLAVAEPECNIGTDVQRRYTIGGLEAAGTSFALVDCPDTPDTRGWFAGRYHDGLNFVFFSYAEPIAAMDGSAPQTMQAILDSVIFQVEDLLQTATPNP